MILESDELAKAVVFFDGSRVIKTMLYAEFEAILDGYVPAIDLAESDCKAVYVEIDSSMSVVTAVFFKVSFGRKGDVSGSWNLPIEQLANMAMRGPDLGGGAIRLACKSQCPIQYFKQSLWDPDIRKGGDHFVMLKKIADANSLAIRFRTSPESEPEPLLLSDTVSAEQLQESIASKLREKYSHAYKEKLKAHRLQHGIKVQELEELVTKLKTEHVNRISEYRAIFDNKDKALKESARRNTLLKRTIDGQAQKIQGLREYFEHKLRLAEGQEQEVLDALRENFEIEMQAKVESKTKDYKELLRMRDVEIENRSEEEVALKKEIARLRKQNQELLNNSGDRLLKKMLSKGISFVNYQPGAGHISIPPEGVSQFMENPIAYAAQQCGVTESHYKDWLRHYQAPVCLAVDKKGHICGENIERCESPIDFHAGDGDRCSKHKCYNSLGKLKVVTA